MVGLGFCVVLHLFLFCNAVLHRNGLAFLGTVPAFAIFNKKEAKNHLGRSRPCFKHSGGGVFSFLPRV